MMFVIPQVRSYGSVMYHFITIFRPARGRTWVHDKMIRMNIMRQNSAHDIHPYHGLGAYDMMISYHPDKNQILSRTER